MLYFSGSLGGPRHLDNRAVGLLIERRATGRKLAERMVLLAHEERAVRERLAHAPLVKRAVLQRVAREIRIRQRVSTRAENPNVSVLYVPRGRVDLIDLQPRVTGAGHRDIGERAL